MMQWPKQSLRFSLSCSLAIASAQQACAVASDQYAAPPPVEVGQPLLEQRYDPDHLDQLVAPIALYPDALVAQILAASAYPDEIAVADQWMLAHFDLHGDALAQEVDKQPWDSSVKSLTPFPSVLETMSENLPWASALGDAYVNRQQTVLDAVQAMRRRAQSAGNLMSTPQETVTTEAQTIAIEPASTDVVYLPEYDPWLVYGTPLAAYPGWAPLQGLYVDGPEVLFGVGLGIGLYAGYGWGWHHWGADWRDHRLMHDHTAYLAHSRAFADPGRLSHPGADFGRTGILGGGPAAMHGFAAPHGLHTGAFSGFGHGGIARAYSFRGQSSVGGKFRGGGFHAGGFHGGGGGFHGGGGHR
jgi:Protein of unknown function (DUF3300)